MLLPVCSPGASRHDAIADSARILYDKGMYAASLSLIEKHMTAADSDSAAAHLELLRGRNMSSLGMNTRAAECFEDALDLARAAGDKNAEADALNSMFKLHFASRNYEGGADLLNSALSIYRSDDNRQGERNILNNIGLLNYANGDYDTALEYYNRALEMTPSDTAAIAKIYINIAEVHYITGDYRMCEEMLGKVVSMIDDSNSDGTGLQALLNLALVKAQRNDRAGTAKLLRRIHTAMNRREPAMLPDAHRQLAEIHFSLGDSLAGLRHVLTADSIAETIESSAGKQQLRQLLTFYSTERLTEHNRSLELAVKNRTLIIYGVAVAAAAIIIIMLMLAARMRSDSRKNRLIREQREQLLEFERMEHERKEQEYKHEIDHKNRQLTSFAIDGAAISELHERVCSNLSKLRRAIPEDSGRQTFDENIAALRNFNRVQVPEDFRTYFNEVHPDFHSQLLKKFTNLTDTDLRLCSFLYLGMSTKEIAALTYREVRSVESSRLRLRKKLGIPANTTLQEFLRTVYH